MKMPDGYRLRKLSIKELKEVLKLHKIWLATESKKGEKANLQNVDLYRAKLDGVDLRHADLQGVNLDEASLQNAFLNGANLQVSSLTDADLRDTQLVDVDFREALLYGTILCGANLTNANLRGAIIDEAELKNANLTNANLQNANLLYADLQEAFLLKATLKEANFQDADLTGVKGLLCGQFAGANVSGAKLPEHIKKFDRLENVAEASRNTRKIFLAMLLGCVYSWLTIATTIDSRLLTNSTSSSLPIIGTPIPIAYFYLAAPIILFAIFCYFQLNLQRLWELFAELPAIFPDGTPLHQKSYPWLLNGLVCIHFPMLRNLRPFLCRSQVCLSVILAWVIVPVTLLLFWARYLPRHHKPYTLAHVILVVLSSVLALFLYRSAVLTLKGKKKRYPHVFNNYIKVSRLYLGTIVWIAIISLCFIFNFTSLAAINGIPYHLKGTTGYDEFPKVKRLVPQILSFFGGRNYADFYKADVSEKPETWIGRLEEEFLMVKGARLKKMNLQFVQAGSAFLVNADLEGANLYGANLTDANLQGAMLGTANLQHSTLSHANLKEAYLVDANLNDSWLMGTKLIHACLVRARLERTEIIDADFTEAYMEGANFQNTEFQRVNFQGADLRRASFQGAHFMNGNFQNANLSLADLRGVQPLSMELLSKAKTLYNAKLDQDLMKAIKKDYPELLEKPSDELLLQWATDWEKLWRPYAKKEKDKMK